MLDAPSAIDEKQLDELADKVEFKNSKMIPLQWKIFRIANWIQLSLT